MNCRNCGAAMAPVGARDYFRCVHCGTFEFPTPLGDGIAAVGAESNWLCPVCRIVLSAGTIEGHPVLFCGGCRGFLATNVEFAEIVPKKRSRFADRTWAPRPFDGAELRRRLGCPACRKSLDTHPYGGGGNAVVDTCHRCHLIWLDAGELEIIGRYRPVSIPDGSPAVSFVGPPREPDTGLRLGLGDW